MVSCARCSGSIDDSSFFCSHCGYSSNPVARAKFLKMKAIGPDADGDVCFDMEGAFEYTGQMAAAGYRIKTFVFSAGTGSGSDADIAGFDETLHVFDADIENGDTVGFSSSLFFRASAGEVFESVVAVTLCQTAWDSAGSFKIDDRRQKQDSVFLFNGRIEVTNLLLTTLEEGHAGARYKINAILRNRTSEDISLVIGRIKASDRQGNVQSVNTSHFDGIFADESKAIEISLDFGEHSRIRHSSILTLDIGICSRGLSQEFDPQEVTITKPEENEDDESGSDNADEIAVNNSEEESAVAKETLNITGAMMVKFARGLQPRQRFYANMDWFEVAEQPMSINDLPGEFKEAKKLWDIDPDGNQGKIIELLNAYIGAVFVADNIFGWEDVFASTGDEGFSEWESFDVKIVGIDFSNSPIPLCKAEAYFDLPMKADFDFETIDSWLEENGATLSDAIGFNWNKIPRNKKTRDLDFTQGSHQGVECVPIFGDTK